MRYHEAMANSSVVMAIRTNWDGTRVVVGVNGNPRTFRVLREQGRTTWSRDFSMDGHPDARSRYVDGFTDWQPVDADQRKASAVRNAVTRPPEGR